MNMRKFYFLSIIAGTVFAYSSCTNDLVEEFSEEVSEHVQTGTPMNFSAKMGGKANAGTPQSSKRKLNYDDSGFVTGMAMFKWETNDMIGVDCPDAYDKDGTVTRAVYKITDPEYGYYTTALESYSGHLYWGEKEVHRVFSGYPAGKVTMGELEDHNDDPWQFTRSFSSVIDHVQNGQVSEEDVVIGEESTPGYRAIDKKNMVCGGVTFFEKSETSQDEVLVLYNYAFFTSVDVVFTPSETDKPITISKVEIAVDKSQIDMTKFSVADVNICGECEGILYADEDRLLAVKAMSAKEGTSYDNVSINVKGLSGEEGFKWSQDKPLSVVLCMFPWSEPQGGEDYTRPFPAKLTVTYQYEGESSQTKTMNISNNYWINARNRIEVPALPHAAVSE